MPGIGQIKAHLPPLIAVWYFPCTELPFPAFQIPEAPTGHAPGIGFRFLIRVRPKTSHQIKESDHCIVFTLQRKFTGKNKTGAK